MPTERSPEWRRELQAELGLLDDRIRDQPVGWSRGATWMVLGGVVLSPALLFGSWMVLLTGAFPGTPPEVRRRHTIGAAFVLLAAVGTFVMGIYGVVRGVRVSRERQTERDEMRRMRDEMQRELDAAGGAVALAPPLLGGLAFRF